MSILLDMARVILSLVRASAIISVKRWLNVLLLGCVMLVYNLVADHTDSATTAPMDARQVLLVLKVVIIFKRWSSVQDIFVSSLLATKNVQVTSSALMMASRYSRVLPSGLGNTYSLDSGILTKLLLGILIVCKIHIKVPCLLGSRLFTLHR